MSAITEGAAAGASVRRTVCNRDCPDACAILATVEAGRVTRIQGDPAHPVTRGFLCHRTSRFLARQYAKERVTQPLLRRGDAFEPIPWDAALDLCAERLVRIRAESGPAAIFHYRSGGSLGILLALTDLFFERFGPVTIKRGDICSGAGDAAQMRDFGEEESHDLFDLRRSRAILLWGKNVYTSSPHLLPILRAAREGGARLALVDPVWHRSAGLCERFVQPRPAGDVALALAVARILFDTGRADPRAEAFCEGLPAFRDLARSRTVEAWCADADVPPSDAAHLADLLASRPAAILIGWGMGRRRNGGAIVRALDALSAISGNIGVPGGGASFYFKRRRAFDTSFVRGEAAAPRTICEPLFGPEVLAARSPEIRAVWVTAGNPVAMLPESETTRRALESREFVVVADAFLTDTARLAHLVLPVPTLLEADDLVGSYGHHWIGSAVPVVPPLGEARSDLAIMQGLAARTGLADVMAGSAAEWKRRILRKDVAAAGVTVERLEREGPQRSPLVGEVLFADRRFPTESGKMRLASPEELHPSAEAAPPDPEAGTGAASEADACASQAGAFQLSLLSLSTDSSQSSQWAHDLEGPAEATVHPDAAPGLADGALARLESRIGAMTVRVRHDARQRRDTVIVPKGGHLRDGRCANALVRATLTDIGEGGALYDERVRLAAC